MIHHALRHSLTYVRLFSICSDRSLRRRSAAPQSSPTASTKGCLHVKRYMAFCSIPSVIRLSANMRTSRLARGVHPIQVHTYT